MQRSAALCISDTAGAESEKITIIITKMRKSQAILLIAYIVTDDKMF